MLKRCSWWKGLKLGGKADRFGRNLNQGGKASFKEVKTLDLEESNQLGGNLRISIFKQLEEDFKSGGNQTDLGGNFRDSGGKLRDSNIQSERKIKTGRKFSYWWKKSKF